MKELTEEGYFKIKGHSRTKEKETLGEIFDKSPENPLNQPHGSYNMTQEEMAEIRAQKKEKIENRLTEK